LWPPRSVSLTPPSIGHYKKGSLPRRLLPRQWPPPLRACPSPLPQVHHPRLAAILLYPSLCAHLQIR
jgi:hypothetical protein